MSTVNQGQIFPTNKLFYVNWKRHDKTFSTPVAVYNIRDDKNGYPHFLICINDRWDYVSAKHFEPA